MCEENVERNFDVSEERKRWKRGSAGEEGKIGAFYGIPENGLILGDDIREFFLENRDITAEKLAAVEFGEKSHLLLPINRGNVETTW